METNLRHYKSTALFVITERFRLTSKGVTVGELARVLHLSRYYAVKIVNELKSDKKIFGTKTGRTEYLKSFTFIPIKEIDAKMAIAHLEIIRHG